MKRVLIICVLCWGATVAHAAVNVFSHGAKGNGVTDDTVAVRRGMHKHASQWRDALFSAWNLRYFGTADRHGQQGFDTGW